LVSRCELVATVGLSGLLFERIHETDERWDLVIPDWLAPDGAEVPFGFRPLIAATRELWPTDKQLDAHGRLVLVPFKGEAHLFALPAPMDETLPIFQ
jgi:hypothetical protein